MKSAALHMTGDSFSRHFRALISGVPRAAMLTLMFLALGVVSLRATCAIGFASHGSGAAVNIMLPAGHAAAAPSDPGGAPDASCCDRVGDATFVKPADLLASWTRGTPLGVVLFASAGMLVFARRRVPQAIFPLAVLPGRSFYARSKRILR